MHEFGVFIPKRVYYLLKMNDTYCKLNKLNFEKGAKMNYKTYQNTQEAKVAYIETFKKVHGVEPKNISDKSRAWFCLQNHQLRRSA